MRATKLRLKKMSPGEVAAEVPCATKLFYKHQLDFCCRGNQRLGDVHQKKDLNKIEVMGDLSQMMRGRQGLDWENVNSGDLSRHIIDHCHAELRMCVPEILRLARKVEAAHPDHPACPVGLSIALGNIWSELEGHMEKEEMILFPLIADGAGLLKSAGPIRRMMAEHIEHCVGLLKIRHLCNGFRYPGDACPTWKALYFSLAELEEDLMGLIHLEDDTLFPRVFDRKTSSRA